VVAIKVESSIFALFNAFVSVSPITVMMGINPMSATAKIAIPTEQPIQVTTVQEVQSLQRNAFLNLQIEVNKMHKETAESCAQRLVKEKEAREKKPGVFMAQFAIGDYVLYADVWVQSQSKLRAKWNGPAMVTRVSSDWIFEIKNLVTQELKEVHASRLKFYMDSELNITGDFLDMVAHNSEGHVVEHLMGHRYDKASKQYELLIKWRGLDKEESTWESVSHLLQDIPAAVKRYMKSKIRDPFVRKMAQQHRVFLEREV
jgi:hypothetical protein